MSSTVPPHPHIRLNEDDTVSMNRININSTNSRTKVATPTRHGSWSERWRKYVFVTVHHLKRHTGLGAICAVAYFDPGNWSVDLQAGSEYGYKLLFVVLTAGLFAVIFQSMASRLGIVTGLDLAAHCRMLLYNRPKHTKFYRWGVLYPLYVLAEVAIISTDLAELIGSATALVLLFPALPLWAGVLLTASDVLLILAFCDPTRGKPVRLFELLIAVLVLAVLISLILIIVEISPDWGDTFRGYLPSGTIVQPGALYISIGIIGATVMPHGLFLGSSLATQDRVFGGPPTTFDSASDSSHSLTPLPSPTTISFPSRLASAISAARVSVVRSFRNNFALKKLLAKDGCNDLPDCDHGYTNWENRGTRFVKAHLTHGIVDIVMSLLGFAVLINSMILIIAGAVFFYGTSEGDNTVPADLFEAHDLIASRVSRAAAVLFAVALLCAGESASITATLAGQIVSEGFLRWKVSPLLRRTLTRLLGLIPSMLVAIIVGRRGINDLLVASQVILSFVLPFVAFPLVYITSSKELMRSRRNDIDGSAGRALVGASGDASSQTSSKSSEEDFVVDTERAEEMKDYSNGKVVMCLGYLIWLVVVVANAYVLVNLAMGKG